MSDALEDIRRQHEEKTRDLCSPHCNYTYLYRNAETVLDGTFTRGHLRQILAMVDEYASKAADLRET